MPKITRLLCGRAGIPNTICLIQSLCSEPTACMRPPLLCPGLGNSPLSHIVCISRFHSASLGMEDLSLLCGFRKFYSLLKAQLHGPLPTSPASFTAPTAFLWQLYNDTKPSIHPWDHTSVYPPKNHTNIVGDGLSRSLDTRNIQTQELFMLSLWKKNIYIILLSTLKKICWRSGCMEKKCALLGTCGC